MLEIDGVRHAIESSGDFERADLLSDTYLSVIDLATRPNTGSDRIVGAHRGRRLLDRESGFIVRQLLRSDEVQRLVGEESVLLIAYLSTLTQVDELIGYANLAGETYGER